MPPSMDMQRAREYVSKVKAAFGANSSLFQEFLNALMLYSQRELSPEAVIARISNLFHSTQKQEPNDHHSAINVNDINELMLGFDEFLPPSYRISNPPSPEKINEMTKRKRRHSFDEQNIVDDDTNEFNPVPESPITASPTTGVKAVGETIAASTSPVSKVAATTMTEKTAIRGTTHILLSPPNIVPSRDLLFNYNPVNGSANDDDIDGDIHGVSDEHKHDHHVPVKCELCCGKRNTIAETNNEPILLCERKGCNAEYHLGCLYNYRPSLFHNRSTNKGNESASKGNDAGNSFMATGAGSCTMLGNGNGCDDTLFCAAKNAAVVTKDMVVPSGEIYCATCHLEGSTAILRKYFDKVDFERSHFTCNRAYVIALLQKNMNQNRKGNVVVVDEIHGSDKNNDAQSGESLKYQNDDVNEAISKKGDATTTLPRRRDQRLRRQYKNTPRSELWYAHELQEQVLISKDVESCAIDEGTLNNGPHNDGSKGNELRHIFSDANSGAFLVGKPIRLYNNLDNEYHIGRIIDWRKCSVYSPLPSSQNCIDAHKSSDNIVNLLSHQDYGSNGENSSSVGRKTIPMNQLQYYGIGPFSTCEFLVRFPSGLQGRRKELLQWIMLEEHSLAVGVSLILGKKTKSSRAVDWKPAMILARSALELVLVRDFLHEDELGNLFATMVTERGDTRAHDKWALASFFGEEQHVLLRLRDEACTLFDHVELMADTSRINGIIESHIPGNDTFSVEDAHHNAHSVYERHSLGYVDVPWALALAEHHEQMRCKTWHDLSLRRPYHRLALISADEYTTQLHLEHDNDSTNRSTSNSDNIYLIAGSNKSIRPLVEKGLDRIWLAHLLADKAPSATAHCSSSVQWSKDDLIDIKYERVTSVSKAMESLQQNT